MEDWVGDLLIRTWTLMEGSAFGDNHLMFKTVRPDKLLATSPADKAHAVSKGIA